MRCRSQCLGPLPLRRRLHLILPHGRPRLENLGVVPKPSGQQGICDEDCATCGAWHGHHIDADGSGTFVGCEDGTKLWITSDHSVVDNHVLEEIRIFFDQNFSVDEAAPTLWDLEAIVLVPGTRM